MHRMVLWEGNQLPVKQTLASELLVSIVVTARLRIRLQAIICLMVQSNIFVTNAFASSSFIWVAHCSIQNFYSHCVLVSFFGGSTDRHFIFFMLSELLRNLFPSEEGYELSSSFLWDSLENNRYVLKFLQLLKDFSAGDCVSLYSVTTWKGKSELTWK